jgi:hypothetical protein
MSQERTGTRRVVGRDDDVLHKDQSKHRFDHKPTQEEILENKYGIETALVLSKLEEMRTEHPDAYKVFLILQAHLVRNGIELPLWEIVIKTGGVFMIPREGTLGHNANIERCAVELTTRSLPHRVDEKDGRDSSYWTYTNHEPGLKTRRGAIAALNATAAACQDGHDLDRELAAAKSRKSPKGRNSPPKPRISTPVPDCEVVRRTIKDA